MSEQLTNLPVQLTSFVGRAYEIAELTRLLGGTRILTLTGAGGVGKTRLAIQTATNLVDRYQDGVWLVELAPLSDPGLVTSEIASSLGVPEQHGRPLIDTLSDHLRPRHALVVLDNCEHLIDRCIELVDTLVRSCPQLQVMATSREALGIAGETDWRVPSLALPDLQRLPPVERLIRSEAIQLFVERATATQSSFCLTGDNAAAVAQICHRLDGIPLAIELAAARIKVLSAEQIAARLDDLFRLLTAGSRTAMPRQQTLRAMVDWSYELLSEPERRLFNRLSVFAGGWTLEAAETIGTSEGVHKDEVLDLLAHLVDKSLVLAEERGPAVRYRLLEPMRQYGAERLRGSGEETPVRGKHLRWFQDFAVQADQQLRGPEQTTWLDRLETEHDNLRAALEWSSTQEQDGEAELELCGALSSFWFFHEHVPEGRRALEHALTRPSRSPAARMRALVGAGWLEHIQQDQVSAREHLAESLSIARELDDLRGISWALHLLGRTYYFDGDALQARTLAEESLAVARAVGDSWLIAWAIHLLGLASYIGGDYPAALTHYQESLRIRQEIGDEADIPILHYLMGFAAYRAGDQVQAIAHYTDSLARAQKGRFLWHLIHVLGGLSALAAAHSQPEGAVLLAAAAWRRSEILGMLPIPICAAILQESIERVRPSLSVDAYAVAWARGLALSEDEALTEARAVAAAVSEKLRGVLPAGPERQGITAPSVQAPPLEHSLSPRELEVLRLIVDGRTSKEIAAELIISVPTVERHITHIYAKIGARRRADATAYAVLHGLI